MILDCLVVFFGFVGADFVEDKLLVLALRDVYATDVCMVVFLINLFQNSIS